MKIAFTSTSTGSGYLLWVVYISKICKKKRKRERESEAINYDKKNMKIFCKSAL